MRVGVLYYGLSDSPAFKECWDNHNKYIFNNNCNYQFDFFIHHWISNKSLKSWCPYYQNPKDGNQENKGNYFIDKDFILNNVKPKKYLFQIQENFSDKKYEKYIGKGFVQHKPNTNTHHPIFNNHLNSKILNRTLNFRACSWSCSIFNGINLLQEYVSDNNVKYDFIIIMRPDLYFFEYINFKEFDLDKFNTLCVDFNYRYSKEINSKKSGHISLPKLHQLFSFSNYNNIIKYSKFFSNIHKYIIKYPNKRVAQPDVTYPVDNFVTNLIYMLYSYCKDIFGLNNINTFIKLTGVNRKLIKNGGVKIDMFYCPKHLLHIANGISRKDKLKLPDDARDYINDKLLSNYKQSFEKYKFK